MYSVKGVDDDMCYFWKIYIINGNVVFYFVFGIIFRDVTEIESEDIIYKILDKDKFFDVGDIVLSDEILVEFGGFVLSSGEIIKIESKEGVVLDKDVFKREGVLFEESGSGEITVYDELDVSVSSLFVVGGVFLFSFLFFSDLDYDGSFIVEAEDE